MSESAGPSLSVIDGTAAGGSGERLETLRLKLLGLIDEAPNPELQVEASRLITSIVDLNPPLDPGDLALVESAVAALGGKSANVRVAKFVRNRLEINLRNRRTGVVPWLSRKLGDSAVYAMLVGVVASALVWAIVFLAVHFGSAAWTAATERTFIMPPDEAYPLAFAALVGGLVSLLSRVNRFANLYIFDPILVFVNSLLKPLVGTVFALTIYAVMRSDIVSVSAVKFDLTADQYRHIFWAFGFVAGFSERLAGDFIARTESVIGRPSEPIRPPR
jgi:hypothetical protein